MGSRQVAANAPHQSQDLDLPQAAEQRAADETVRQRSQCHSRLTRQDRSVAQSPPVEVM